MHSSRSVSIRCWISRNSALTCWRKCGCMMCPRRKARASSDAVEIEASNRVATVVLGCPIIAVSTRPRTLHPSGSCRFVIILSVTPQAGCPILSAVARIPTQRTARVHAPIADPSCRAAPTPRGSALRSARTRTRNARREPECRTNSRADTERSRSPDTACSCLTPPASLHPTQDRSRKHRRP